MNKLTITQTYHIGYILSYRGVSAPYIGKYFGTTPKAAFAQCCLNEGNAWIGGYNIDADSYDSFLQDCKRINIREWKRSNTEIGHVDLNELVSQGDILLSFEGRKFILSPITAGPA